MSYFLSISLAAESDIRDAFLWYEDQKPNLGKLFEEHISDAIESIQSNPLKTQVRYDHIRVFYLSKFPFGIHYQVDEIGKYILIIAVFHMSRDSEKWKMRI